MIHKSRCGLPNSTVKVTNILKEFNKVTLFVTYFYIRTKIAIGDVVVYSSLLHHFIQSSYSPDARVARGGRKPGHIWASQDMPLKPPDPPGDSHTTYKTD